MSSSRSMNLAQVIINCIDLNVELDFFTAVGFKLLQVFPADNPRMMLVGAEGLTLRLEKSDCENQLTLQLPETFEHMKNTLTSPHGVVLRFHSKPENPSRVSHSSVLAVKRFGAESSWVNGRAGMLYRDLITDRLGGSMIASNIMIPEGGPVPDHVHFHHVQFQLIFCLKGWVKVVYEDQGAPFVLYAGDCVTQPPGIRHQVLESSDGLEVLEIGLPAEHMTALDYDMKLPTGRHLPDRLYGDSPDNQQKFCHHLHTQAQWQVESSGSLLVCQTGVESACAGLAAVHVLKACDNIQPVELKHHDTVRFYYLMAGDVVCTTSDSSQLKLSARDSFVLPPDLPAEFNGCSADFQCIEFILRKP